MSISHALVVRDFAPREAGHSVVRSRTIVSLATLAGVLSGLRLLVTYRLVGVELSLGDALGSGLMDWWCWIPFVPSIFRIANRMDAAQRNALGVFVLHAAIGAIVSLCHLSLFSALSGVVRNLRFGDAFRVDLASPLFSMLVPGMAVYGLLVLGCWWHGARLRRSESGTRGRAVDAPEENPVRFKVGRGQLLLRATEIDWIRAAGNYLELHTNGRTHLVRETLGGLHERLGRERFRRIHRSTLVRRDAVHAVHEGSHGAVVLHDGTRLPIGKTFRERPTSPGIMQTRTTAPGSGVLRDEEPGGPERRP